MSFTAAIMIFLLVCAAVGLLRAREESSTLLVASLAAAMACVQLVLLLTK